MTPLNDLLDRVKGATYLPTDTETLRSLLEVEETRSLWTVPHTFTPRLVGEVWGDGRRLMALTTINNRPAYWIVRVGSDWDASDEGPQFACMVDDILTAIEEEFGSSNWDRELENAKEDAHYQRVAWAEGTLVGPPRPDPDEASFWVDYAALFPAICDEMGCSWGGIDWPGQESSLLPATLLADAGHSSLRQDAEAPGIQDEQSSQQGQGE